MTARTSRGASGMDGRGDYAGILSGRKLAQFELQGLLGAGGFGEVYRARDKRLGRTVAVKVLPAEVARDAERRERFRREAIAASALNHPNICTVHDLVETEGHWLIVMELVEGETLHERLVRGRMEAPEALAVATQIAEALGEAHRAGILHRDVKCRNIAVNRRGQAKVLDFGLAKLLERKVGEDDRTLPSLTEEGSTAGTPGYMSPEQLLGKPLDARSDLFGFGVVLYRMVTGRLPFEGATREAMADAILNAEPRGFADAKVPARLKEITRKLLKKEPAKRYASADEVRAELQALSKEMGPEKGRSALSRRGRLALVSAGFLFVAAGGWQWARVARERWALRATAEAARLVDEWEHRQAAELIRQARAVLPNNTALEDLWLKATLETTIETEPEGAEVRIRPLRGGEDEWESLGRTPLRKVRVPRDRYAWWISEPGYASTTILMPPVSELRVRLVPERNVPAGMVPVPGEEVGIDSPALRDVPVALLEDFFIDRHEVSNREFKAFVDAGGYRRRELWRGPFLRDGREVSWEEAIASLRDSTGQPGPATWEAGGYPEGLDEHPVAGVSWYEAAAYAEYVGKSLPTVYHWQFASSSNLSWLIAPGSNFHDAGTWPAGRPGTLSGWGTTDMAGNVKEWCRNEGPGGRRYVMGGGFGEPDYMFVDHDAQSPWERRPNIGFRCVKLASPPHPSTLAKLEPRVRDLAKEKPVSDEVFAAFRGLYAYDEGELNARLEEREEAADWTRERISFDAAYGGERVLAHLFLPRNADPPFQAVVYFPGSGAIYQEKLNTSDFWGNNFVPKSGRALLIPVFKGTYERRSGLKSDVAEPTASWRDHMLAWSRDLGRSLDYLETRGDIDTAKLAYVGNSWGTCVGPVLLAVEDRFKAAIFLQGGLPLYRALPEAEPLNFVTRVRLPVLMLNGRYDAFTPVESSQRPLFRLLGTPDGTKRHVIYDSGHVVPRKERIRESLAWLDRYLGPVTPRPAAK